MVDTINQDYFCSTLSVEAQEPLFGSAPVKNVWLLLEYTQPWGAKAFPDSTLAAPVKAHISAFLDGNPAANILFIRKLGRRRENIAFFVAVVDEQNPQLYEFALDDYDDLCQLDFAAIVRGELPAHLSHDPLFLVCTNSKRDKCCAKLGIGIFKELRHHAADRVWQCSHLGGHRFAPTSLFLPQGICYGRMTPGTMAAMMDAHQNGHMTLENLRGRACYDQPTQAADYLLRAELGLTALDRVRHVESRETSVNQWTIRFQIDDEMKDIHLEKVQTDVEIFTSCSNDKTAFVEEYRRV